MTVLPRGWTLTNFGHVVDYGFTEKAEPAELAETDWVLELEDIEKNTSKLLQRVSFGQRQSKSTKNRFQSGDILYGKLRPTLNKVILADEPGVCTTEIIPLRVPEGISSKYIFYALKRSEFLEYVASVSHGMDMPRLGTQAGRQAPLPLPPSKEQQRIVAKLDSLHARSSRARHELDRIPKLIERYKQAILAKAFSGELTKDWRQEHQLDEEWGSETVGRLATDIRYGTAAKCSYEKTDTAVLRIPNIGKSGIDLNDLKYAKFSKHETSKLALADGDLLFIRSNGSIGLVGRAAVVTRREAGLLYAGYLIRVRLDQRRVVPRFVLYLFSEPTTRASIEALAKSTSGVNNINSEQLSAVMVPLPTIEEQAEIVRRIEFAYQWLDKIATEHAGAEHLLPKLDQAILAKAFRGELVPQDPNDEPAFVLLERIKDSKATTARSRKRTTGQSHHE